MGRIWDKSAGRKGRGGEGQRQLSTVAFGSVDYTRFLAYALFLSLSLLVGEALMAMFSFCYLKVVFFFSTRGYQITFSSFLLIRKKF